MFKLLLFRDNINCCHSHTGKTQVPSIIWLGSFSKFPVRTPALLCVGVPRGVLIRAAHLKFSKSKFWCDFWWRETSSRRRQDDGRPRQWVSRNVSQLWDVTVGALGRCAFPRFLVVAKTVKYGKNYIYKESIKLNVGDSPACYTTVLHKYNSQAVFCEKTPKKARN